MQKADLRRGSPRTPHRAVVRAFLMGCAVILMVVGCAGVRSQAPREEQGNTKATKEQTHSSGAASSEEARCRQTRTFKDKESGWLITTNDLPGCPNGGLLSGTEKDDKLSGNKGEDEIRGLGGSDFIFGGDSNDVIYGGPGNEALLLGSEGDDVIYAGDGDDGETIGGNGEDVVYGGDGNDSPLQVDGDRQRDKLYCGAGRDHYFADKIDYVDSSCEAKVRIIERIP